jgi:hypothetical protein
LLCEEESEKGYQAMSKTEIETTKHLIAASNFLLGVANFIILPLPKSWRLGIWGFPPEVNSNVRRGDFLWVNDGRASHILFNEEKGVGVELIVNISRGKRNRFRPRLSEVKAQGATYVGGHEATYVLGKTAKGLFKKKTFNTLQLSFYCNGTGRTINVELTGKCDEEDLHSILEAISGLECH